MTSGPEGHRQLGRYQLLFMLGQGGMGEVHLAKLSGAAGFEKLCIVKTILPQMQSDPQFVDRFHHEARVLVHLNHSNIAQVYDMGDVEGTLYMAIEYVPGVDLARVASRAQKAGAVVPIPIALYLGQQIAEALGYAHRKTGPDGSPLGIVHRDVSPQNVMVSYEGEVKVIDFGLAKSAVRSKHTLPSTVMGKLGYMSPEQAMALPLDHRSDIYSAGIVVWELLAGRPLFEGGTMAEMVVKMAQPSIPPLRTVRPEISPALEQVVGRALAVDPAARYSRADDFARALNELAVREQLTVGAEEVGNYVRAMCPEEFAAERALQSKLSILRKRGSGPATPAPAPPELEGTLLRPSSAGATPAPLTPAQRALSVAEPQVEPRRAASQTGVVARRPGSGAADVQEPPSAPMVVPRSKAPWIVVGVLGVAAAGVLTAAFLKSQSKPEPLAVGEPPVAEAKVDAGEPVAVAEPTKPVEPSPEPEPEPEPAAAAEPTPIRTIAAPKQKFLVKQAGDSLALVLKDKKALKKGDELEFIGDPGTGKSAPVYAEGVVLGLDGPVATIAVYDDAALPAKVYAVKHTAPQKLSGTRKVGRPKAPGAKAPPEAEPTASASPGGTAAEPEPTKVAVADPIVPAMAVDNPFDKGSRTAPPPTPRPEPTRVEPAKAEPTRVEAPAPTGPVKQVTGSIQLLGPKTAWVARFLNSSSFSLTGCQLRLPGALTFKFTREIYSRGAADVPMASFAADPRPADPQFAKGWAAMYCREGTGYVFVYDQRK